MSSGRKSAGDRRQQARRGFGLLTIVSVVALTMSGISGLSTAQAPDPDERSSSRDNVVLRWNDTALQALISAGMGPPVTARALAVLHTCMYDAWAAYDGKAVGTRYGGRLREPVRERTLRNKNEAISHAAYTAAMDLWPKDAARFDAQMRRLGYPVDARTRPAVLGARACRAVLEFRHDDASNQLGDLAPGAYSDYTGYTPANEPMDVTEPLDLSTVKDPNRWQPITINGSDALPATQTWTAPHFGNVTPFAMRSWDQFTLSPPAVVGDPEYKRQADELIHYAANLTDRQKVISEHWADEGPGFVGPPGTWSKISQVVSHRDHHTVDQDAKMFFAVTNAVFDAAVGVWGYKRYYDSVRPITAIRYLYHGKQIPSFRPAGGEPSLIDGASWMPYQPLRFITPGFADFPSGHSAFGTAAAEVLSSFTGSDRYGASYTVKAGSSRVEPGASPRTDVTLAWPTFTAAADENGISRLYGGLHFRDADLGGRSLGRQAGATAWTAATRYFSGTAAQQD